MISFIFSLKSSFPSLQCSSACVSGTIYIVTMFDSIVTIYSVSVTIYIVTMFDSIVYWITMIPHIYRTLTLCVTKAVLNYSYSLYFEK